MSADVGELLRRAASSPVGPLDYDWVDRRARERRRRRNLLRVVGASAATVAVVAAVGVVATSGGPAVVTPAPAPSAVTAPAVTAPAAPWTANRVVPVVRRHGSGVVMPLVLPDGSRVEVSLPASSVWDDMDANPNVGLYLEGVGERDVIVPRGGLAWFAARGLQEAEILAEPGRTVTLWEVREEGELRRYLVFDFGAWVVGVRGEMSDAQLRTFARSLHGSLVDGFLVLRPAAPLRFLGPEDGATPPMTQVGDDRARRGIAVWRAGCSRVLWDTGEGFPANRASVCRPEWGVSVEVYGARAFVDSVLGSLKVTSELTK
jgi:hypothetical protein